MAKQHAFTIYESGMNVKDMIVWAVTGGIYIYFLQLGQNSVRAWIPNAFVRVCDIGDCER